MCGLPWLLALCACVAQGAAPVTRCDRLAANPADLDRIAPGVYWEVMDGTGAREACEAALAQYPEEPRLLYQYGRALSRLDRYDEAVPVLSRAAESGHLVAYMGLGSIYHFVTANYSEAASWYRQGAELGSASAQVLLGDMYRNGEGFDKDPETAVAWYRKAAIQGYGVAQSKLGYVYEHGIGVTRNAREAARWYQLAAEDGEPQAQYNLARMMLAGAGVPRQPERGAAWMEKAAEQGFGEALLATARLYRDGTGVTARRREAFYWYVVATRHRESRIREGAEAGLAALCQASPASSGQSTVAWCCPN
jgi:TPR repeat protein